MLGHRVQYDERPPGEQPCSPKHTEQIQQRKEATHKLVPTLTRGLSDDLYPLGE